MINQTFLDTYSIFGIVCVCYIYVHEYKHIMNRNIYAVLF